MTGSTHSLVSREATSPLEVGSRLQGIEGCDVLAVFPCTAPSAPAPATRPTPTPAEDAELLRCDAELLRCDRLLCLAIAVRVMKYRDQEGHIHLCPRHEREDREFCDVVWSAPMPCPLPHGDSRWIDSPPELP